MPSSPSPASGSSLAEPNAARLSLLYAVVFVEIGIAMPFMPVWLNALGLDPRIIGALLALPIAVRIVATAPLLSLIDRGLSARALIVSGSFALAATYALMPEGAGVGWPVLAVLIGLNAVAGAPLVPSIDYLTLAAVRRSRQLHYARIQMAGSIGFLAASLAGGAVLSAFGERPSIPWLLAALAVVAGSTALATRIASPPSPRQIPESRRVPLPAILWLAVAAAASVQSSHGAIYAFASIHWGTHGIAAPWIGALWAIGVVSEIALFAVIGRVPAAWRTPFRLIGLGAGAALVRAVGMAFLGDRLEAVLVLQLLHGFTFGATQLGAMEAVSRFAPEGARGRAQGTFSASNALASATSTLLSGLAYEAGGGPLAFALMAPLALAGLVLSGLAHRRHGA